MFLAIGREGPIKARSIGAHAFMRLGAVGW